MAIVTTVGPLGSGKTVLQTYFVWCAWFYGRRRVFSNYHLNFPHTRISTPKQLLETENGVVALDEAHLILDSRNFGAKLAMELTHWLTLTRHFHLDVYATTQAFGQVDTRFRDLTDYAILAEKRQSFFLYKVFSTFYQRQVNSFKIPKHQWFFSLYDSYDKDKSGLALASAPAVTGGAAQPSAAKGDSGSRRVVTSIS